MPPQYSAISSRTVMPAGARWTPGFATRPETENERGPLRPCRPWFANQSAPFSRMSRTQYSVSMLCSSVGRPKSPTCATAELDFGQRARRIGRERVELPREDRAAPRILIAQVDIDRLDAHGPSGDQHAFEEAVRIAL